MPEENNCPKPTCGQPESTHRWSAGKKLSICGNGHSWDQQAIQEQRAKAKEAEYQEIKIEFRAPDPEEIRKRFEREFGDPFRPSANNPFR